MKPPAAGGALLLLLLTAELSSAQGQSCEPAWQAGHGVPGVSGAVYCLASLGADDPRFLAGGWIEAAGELQVANVALWNGDAWETLGDGLPSAVETACAFDFDGPGPGVATWVAGCETGGVWRWAGHRWELLAGLPSGTVRSLVAFDRDAAGPAPERLVAAISVNSGSPTQITVHEWDGAVWRPLGGSFTGGGVGRLFAWEPQGPGPTHLLAAGAFSSPQGCVQRWNGVTWSPVAPGLTGSATSVAFFDPDGGGIAPARLVVGGGGLSINAGSGLRVVSLAGGSWQPMDAGLGSGFVEDLTIADPDGAGPAGPTLIAAGDFGLSGLAVWRGQTWEIQPGLPPGARAVRAVRAPGGAPGLVAGGTFLLAGGSPAHRVALWDGTAWRHLGAGSDGAVHAVCSFDFDGKGQDLVAGGTFTLFHGVRADRVVRVKGGVGEPLGHGFNGTVAALVSHDAGGGSGTARLVAGGEFTGSGPAPLSHVARWNGERWEPLGTGTNGAVYALATFDFDGPGGEPASLVAAGAFTLAGGVEARSVARWDGSSWQPLGAGAPHPARVLATFDADGPGPLSPVLLAGGTIGGYAGVAQWDGTSWQTIGAFSQPYTAGVIRALLSWDEDGAGPDEPVLVAAGSFGSGEFGLPWNVATWDGQAWSPLGRVHAAIHALAAVDPDGPGVGPRRLVAGGSFFFPGDVSRAVAEWDGAAWRALDDGGKPAPAYALHVRPLHGGAIELVAGGAFVRFGDVVSARFARWSCTGFCYANCDGSTVAPLLNVADFSCFLRYFAAGSAYANCDGSSSPPVLTVADFACFLERFGSGCP